MWVSLLHLADVGGLAGWKAGFWAATLPGMADQKKLEKKLFLVVDTATDGGILTVLSFGQQCPLMTDALLQVNSWLTQRECELRSSSVTWNYVA